MQSAHRLGLAVALTLWPAVAFGANAECTIKINGLLGWGESITVAESRIAGGTLVLNRKDDAVFGWLGDHPTRLQIKANGLTGRVDAEVVTLMQISQGDSTRFVGSVGFDRVTATVAGDSALSLGSKTLALELVAQKDNPNHLRDPGGFLDLVFDGCGATVFQDRPELVLYLHQVFLPRFEAPGSGVRPRFVDRWRR